MKWGIEGAEPRETPEREPLQAKALLVHSREPPCRIRSVRPWTLEQRSRHGGLQQERQQGEDACGACIFLGGAGRPSQASCYGAEILLSLEH